MSFRTRIPARSGLLVALALATGCAAQTASFRPAKVSRHRGAGFPSAHYRIMMQNVLVGSVKVWSEGGYPLATDHKKAVIDVRLRIRNDSEGPITLDVGNTDVDVITADRHSEVVKKPLQTNGDTTVAAGGIGRVTLFYPLPDDLKAGDLAGFELNWILHTPKGSYSESTSFVRRHYQGGYYYWPYYYGWWGSYSPYYPSWYWGWGWFDWDDD